MKMSFLPGGLFLETTNNGQYTVRINGEIVLTTKSAREAQKRYDAIRKDMEARFPAPELTLEDKLAAGRAAQLDSLVGHNSFQPPKKTKSRGSTRTFG